MTATARLANFYGPLSSTQGQTLAGSLKDLRCCSGGIPASATPVEVSYLQRMKCHTEARLEVCCESASTLRLENNGSSEIIALKTTMAMNCDGRPSARQTLMAMLFHGSPSAPQLRFPPYSFGCGCSAGLFWCGCRTTSPKKAHVSVSHAAYWQYNSVRSMLFISLLWS